VLAQQLQLGQQIFAETIEPRRALAEIESVQRFRSSLPTFKSKRQRKYTIDKHLGCELRDSHSSDEREWLRADWTDYPHPDCILRHVYVESGRWWDR